MAVETFILNNEGIIGLISFILGMFFAEETIFTLTLLNIRRLVGINNIIFALFGVMFCNLSLYFSGRMGLFKFIKKFSTLSSFLKKMEKKIERISKGKMEKALFFSKFILGGRLILSAFLGHRKIKFSKFLFNMILIEIIWALIAISFGIFLHESYEFISKIVKGIAFFGFSSLVLIFGVYYTKQKIKEKALNNTGHNIIVEENGYSTKKGSDGLVCPLDLGKKRLLRV